MGKIFTKQEKTFIKEYGKESYLKLVHLCKFFDMKIEETISLSVEKIEILLK